MLKTKKRGFTLTEIAIVLGIIGLILGAIWSAAGSARQNQKIQLASRELVTIVTNMKAYQGQLPVAGNLGQQMCKVGVFPPEMVSDPAGCTNPKDPWGHYISLSSIDAYNYSITYYGMPAPACVAMLLLNGTTAMSSVGLVSASAGATGTSPGGSMTMTGGSLVAPITADTAAMNCPSTSNFNGSTINGYSITFAGTVVTFTFNTQ